MSRLDKFINHPKEFFNDAFKKREDRIANKLNLANDYLKNIGIPIQFDLRLIEQCFINVAIKLSHNNKLGSTIIALISLEQQSSKEIDDDSFSKIGIIHYRFRYLLKISNHLLSGNLTKTTYLKQSDPLKNLSPEAKTIYLQLIRKIRDAGDH